MPRPDFIQAPTQVTGADNAIAALKFDAHWLLELSNADPASVARRIDELYSIMNIIQLVTSRFARVCNDTREQAAVREAINQDMGAGK